MNSPVGHLVLRARRPRAAETPGPVLTGLFFTDGPRGGDPRARDPGLVPDDAFLEPVRRELEEYFAGGRHDFSFAIELEEGTAFQRAVWLALAKIPFGETCSYAELARAVERPRAVRAVGAANGRNPLAIVLPCHRVIGSDGSLVGYGGGLDRKQTLLALERGSA